MPRLPVAGGLLLAGLVLVWFVGLGIAEHGRLAGGLWHGPIMAAIGLGIGYGCFVWLRDALPVRPVSPAIVAWYALCIVAACIGISRVAGTLPAAIAGGTALGAYLVLHAPRPMTNPLRRLLLAFLLALVPLGWLAHDYFQALSQTASTSERGYDARVRRDTRKAVAGAQAEIARRLDGLFDAIDADAEPPDAVKELAEDEMVKLAVYADEAATGKILVATRFKTTRALAKIKITHDEARLVKVADLDSDTARILGREIALERARRADQETIRSIYQEDDRIHFFVGRRPESRIWLLLLDHEWLLAEVAQPHVDRAGLEDQVLLKLPSEVEAGKDRVVLPADQMPRYLGYGVPVRLQGALALAKDKDQQRQFFTMVWFATLLIWTLGAFWRLYRTAREDVALAQMKQNFVSAISHELKTPLAMIKMYSEMLLLGLVGEGKRPEEYHGIIIQETDRLTRLIDNVLDFSKIQKGTKTYHFEEIDLAEVAAAALRNMEPVFDREGVAVTFEAAPGLVVRADRDAIYQALLNLLSNAVKYGGTSIAIKAARRGREVQIAVQDAGPGIPRKERAKIFRPFYRIGREEERTAQGTGLGLALVDEIMKAHKGAIRLQSRPGAGSTFVMAFPEKARA